MFSYLTTSDKFLILKDGKPYAEIFDIDFGLKCFELLMKIEVDKLNADVRKNRTTEK